MADLASGLNKTDQVLNSPLVETGGIPQALKDLDRWIVWKHVHRDGKDTKVPIDPISGCGFDSTKPEAAKPFNVALDAYLTGKYAGIGFVLGKGVVGIDLDDCLTNSELKDDSWQQDLIYALGTYTEISPSGNGLKMIGISDLQHKGISKAKIELYSCSRFFTVTGMTYDGLDELADITMGHRRLYEEHKTPDLDASVVDVESDDSDMTEADRSLCARIADSKQGKKFQKLLRGDWSDYDSQSEADFALVSILHFWTDADSKKIDRIFRASGLYRDKWDSRREKSTYGADTIRKVFAGASETIGSPRSTPEEDFRQFRQSEPEQSQIIDIFGNLDLQPFPTDLLPEIVSAYAIDQGELIGVDPGVIGMTALAAIAGCIDDRIVIKPKRHDPTWTESARLWIANIGAPSCKKTPGMNKALGPVRKIAAKWREEYQAEKSAWDAECEELLEKDKKAKLPEPPICKRLTFGDVTVEKLADELSKLEPRGVLIDRDELTQWLHGMDAYKGTGGKDRADWLKAYDGGPNQVDRIKRGSVYIENWSASVIGGIQPQVIQKYAAVTDHDGMLQRFLLYMASLATRGVDRYPNMAAKESYYETFNHIAHITPGCEPVTLSEEAHGVREEFSDRVFRAMSSFYNPHLTSMLGKWDGVFARLLLVYHVFGCAVEKVYPASEEVSGETARKVADLLWLVLLPQAISFYNGIDQTEDHAKSLAGLILAKRWMRFTVKRDLTQNMRSWRKLTEFERGEILDRLESYNWIKPEAGKFNNRGRPTAYEVNPEVHTRFEGAAAKERARREKVVTILNELKDTKC